MGGMTLLAVFAHPDDEAFGSGGVLARHAEAGVDVHLISATRGESGKITDPDIDPGVDVGALREGELRDACAALGIHAPHFLDFHDSGRHERTRYDDPKALRNVDELELEQALRPFLAELRPEVMLTFDPHGIYGHIDHIRIHRAATAAFWSAGGVTDRPPKRLFYSAMSRERMARMQAARERSPLAQLDPGLYGVGEEDFAVVVDVEPWLERKLAAIAAHRSQVGPSSSFANARSDREDEAWRALMARETFTLGGLRGGGFPDAPVDDMFAGL